MVISRFKLIGLLSIVALTACANTESTSSANVRERLNEGTSVSVTLPASAIPSANPIPEPLRLASEQLSSGNIDRAMTYLGLTISDFPGTEAAYIASVVQSSILTAKVQSNTYILSALTKGSENSSSSLLGLEGTRRMADVLEVGIANNDKSRAELEPTVKYVLNNYAIHTDQRVSPVFEFTPTAPEKDLSFFESVGYPVPTDSEIDEAKTYAFQYLVQDNLSRLFKDDETIDYVSYFYSASPTMVGGIYGEEVLNEVLKLTEDNKYDERRIDIQEYLKSQ